MSRFVFFTRAAQHDLEQLVAESLTQQIDAVVAVVEGDDSARDAAAAGRRRLARGEDRW